MGQLFQGFSIVRSIALLNALLLPVRREYFDEDVQQSSFSEVEPVYEPPPPSFGFGLGFPQQPEVVVKQAGPSQSYGWLGHGRSINLNSLLIPNPFPDTMNVNTKWVPAVDHSMEQIVHNSEHIAHSAHIEPAPREEHRQIPYYSAMQIYS